MKIAIVLAAVLAVSTAQTGQYSPGRYVTPLPNRVAASDQAASIISYENEIFPDGAFRYAFQTDNGISAEATGTPKALSGNPPVTPVVHQGSYSFISPEGVPVAISYIADENGYQPQGDVIPTSPPVPEPILRALQYIASRPPAPQK